MRTVMHNVPRRRTVTRKVRLYQVVVHTPEGQPMFTIANNGAISRELADQCAEHWNTRCRGSLSDGTARVVYVCTATVFELADAEPAPRPKPSPRRVPAGC
jgi:hypothetical protein